NESITSKLSQDELRRFILHVRELCTSGIESRITVDNITANETQILLDSLNHHPGHYALFLAKLNHEGLHLPQVARLFDGLVLYRTELLPELVRPLDTLISSGNVTRLFVCQYDLERKFKFSFQIDTMSKREKALRLRSSSQHSWKRCAIFRFFSSLIGCCRSNPPIVEDIESQELEDRQHAEFMQWF
ncbi:hypothetical protein PENTCL1PPCAC_12415, partial [Pristionchus entomophagus]